MGNAWTIKAMLDWIAGYLGEKGDENPLMAAQAMVSNVTGLQKIQLYMSHDRLLDEGQLARLRDMVKRRAAGEPLQYLLGTAPFRYLDIKVRPGVLIPRPETEVLVSELLSQLPSAQRRVAADSLLNEYEGAAALEAMRQGAADLDAAMAEAARHQTAGVLTARPAGASALTGSAGSAAVTGTPGLAAMVLADTVAAAGDEDEFPENEDRYTGEYETFGGTRTGESHDSQGEEAATREDSHDVARSCPSATRRAEALPKEVGPEGKKTRDYLLIADLCTGSGCIACSLATERDDVRVVAVDLSPEAVALAKENVAACGASERVGVLCGDLGSPIEKARPQFMGTFDAVVSNPPYVPTAVLAELPHEVADFEPELALDGGEDGLDLYRRILEWSMRALRDGGVLAVELHETCLDDAASLAREAGFKNVRVVLDLASRPRVLTACK